MLNLTLAGLCLSCASGGCEYRRTIDSLESFLQCDVHVKKNPHQSAF